MLGTVLRRLTDATLAEELLTAIGDEALPRRVENAAREAGVSPGVYVAAAVRHLLDHGGEEVWLDLIGRMANSPRPGVAALQAILAWAFPARVPLRPVSLRPVSGQPRSGQPGSGRL